MLGTTPGLPLPTPWLQAVSFIATPPHWGPQMEPGVKHLQESLPFLSQSPPCFLPRTGQVHTHPWPTHLRCRSSKHLWALERTTPLTSRKAGAGTVRPPLTQRMWVLIPEVETDTYPIDVPLAVAAVAASREGVILSIKLLWLVKQGKQCRERKAEKLPRSPS